MKQKALPILTIHPYKYGNCNRQNSLQKSRNPKVIVPDILKHKRRLQRHKKDQKIPPSVIYDHKGQKHPVSKRNKGYHDQKYCKAAEPVPVSPQIGKNEYEPHERKVSACG